MTTTYQITESDISMGCRELGFMPKDIYRLTSGAMREQVKLERQELVPAFLQTRSHR